MFVCLLFVFKYTHTCLVGCKYVLGICASFVNKVAGWLFLGPVHLRAFLHIPLVSANLPCHPNRTPNMPIRFVSLAFLLATCGALLAGCTPDCTRANPELGRRLEGEWALAELRNTGAANPLLDFATGTLSALTGPLRLHYVFNLDGQCRTRIWNPISKQMADSDTGEWKIEPDGNTIEIRIGPAGGVRIERYRVETRDNQVLLYSANAQDQIALVMMRPEDLPEPGSEADRQRIAGQAGRAGRGAAESLDTLVNVMQQGVDALRMGLETFADSLNSGLRQATERRNPQQ